MYCLVTNMELFLVLLFSVLTGNLVLGLTEDETLELSDTCCPVGEKFAVTASATDQCTRLTLPDEIELNQREICLELARSCCELQFRLKEECNSGISYSPSKLCVAPKSEISKTCCDECTLGRLSGESQGVEACGDPMGAEAGTTAALRNYAFYQCCVEAAKRPETTTEQKTEETAKKSQTCQADSCEHECDDTEGYVRCSCREGFRLQPDKKSCLDINECAEAIDDLCTIEGTVCHNTPGSFKCVPFMKRDVSLTCPPGFKRNTINQVCDDINECQLPRPPCPKYLCENTIGGYKCNGKPGKAIVDAVPGVSTEVNPSSLPTEKNDICPPGFRAGTDDECVDIDECVEHFDDCQRLSQHCINTHGNFFCQDHVSKRCAPGFKVNPATGICEDIDECKEGMEVCQRNQVCVNLPGAYDCKSKISTLPQLTRKKNCQEGTRPGPGGSTCEDIDECREGKHLCDQFQNCINTYGGHECRCKNGFELDSTSGSCVDVDECALKMDSCGSGLYCLNTIGSYTCTHHSPITTTITTTSTTPPPEYEYEYYDTSEENGTESENSKPILKPAVQKITTTVRTIPTAPRTLRPTTARTPPTTERTTTTTQRASTTERTTTYITTTPTPKTTTIPLTTNSTTTKTSTTISTTTPRWTTSLTTRRTLIVPPPPYFPPEPPSYAARPTTVRPVPSATTSRTPFTNLPSWDNYNPITRPSPYHPMPERPVYYYPRPNLTEVTLPEPRNPAVIEVDKDPNRGYEIDTNEIPKDKWTNVVGRDKPDEPIDFDINNLHCLDGFERDANGQCVDLNECTSNRHMCNSMEMCINNPGSYSCECASGYKRDSSTGRCVMIITTARSTTSATRRTTTATTTTESRTPEWNYQPRPTRPYLWTPHHCDFGYKYDTSRRGCVDVDECTTNATACKPTEDCVNLPGGYNCICGSRCRAENTPSFNYPTPTYHLPSPDSDANIITVGSQYGSRGSRVLHPQYDHYGNTVVAYCPWGYVLSSDRLCMDIDECSGNSSLCGPQQHCENFYGGYSCNCPKGHRLLGQDSCEDVDECIFNRPCAYNAKCINTPGSYRCECGQGFRNAPSNDKVCVDIDECVEQPSLCDQGCANAWGSYRCFCNRGYRLHVDNRTCVDVDECAEMASSRIRGRLCSGQCVNTPGSYRCGCPKGYRLSEDGRSCIDIDECENGEASCADSTDEVCTNTRGGYHCHRINCPPGYRLESKHRCSRIQRQCLVTDMECMRLPSSYSYNFITFASNIYLPPIGSVDLFTMHGPGWSDAMFNFELRMVDSRALSPSVTPTDDSCFQMRQMHNVCVVSLVCSLQGPQVAELELSMSLYQMSHFAGTAVARLVVIVSEYEY